MIYIESLIVFAFALFFSLLYFGFREQKENELKVVFGAFSFVAWLTLSFLWFPLTNQPAWSGATVFQTYTVSLLPMAWGMMQLILLFVDLLDVGRSNKQKYLGAMEGI